MTILFSSVEGFLEVAHCVGGKLYRWLIDIGTRFGRVYLPTSPNSRILKRLEFGKSPPSESSSLSGMAVSARLTNPNTAQDTRFAIAYLPSCFLCSTLFNAPRLDHRAPKLFKRVQGSPGILAVLTVGVNSAFYDTMFKSNEMTKHLQVIVPCMRLGRFWWS